jgi:hypothetical protein
MAKTACVRMLFGSWEGLKSSDVAMGRSAVILVHRIFFCFIRRWPLLVASDFARCLVTRDAVRPGHELKWPRWMARRNVTSYLVKRATQSSSHSCPREIREPDFQKCVRLWFCWKVRLLKERWHAWLARCFRRWRLGRMGLCRLVGLRCSVARLLRFRSDFSRYF